MTSPARDRQGGFALVESIAVLVLAALVLLALLVATGIVSRGSAVAARRAGDLETLATALAAVRRDLEGALYVPSSPEPESPILFSGNSDSVGVVVETDRSGRGLGESLISIETRYGGQTGALIRSSAPLVPGTSGFAGVRFGASTLLAEGPWRYRFSYADYADGRLVWTGSRSGATSLPAAVRLEVLDAGGRRVVPALTARLQINSGGCLEDGQECAKAAGEDDSEGGHASSVEP